MESTWSYQTISLLENKEKEQEVLVWLRLKQAQFWSLQKLALNSSSVTYQLPSHYILVLTSVSSFVTWNSINCPIPTESLKPKVLYWVLSHQVHGHPTVFLYVIHQLEFLVFLEESRTELRSHGNKWRGAGKKCSIWLRWLQKFSWPCWGARTMSKFLGHFSKIQERNWKLL